MQLEVGKLYKTRNGSTVHITDYKPDITLSNGQIIHPTFSYKGNLTLPGKIRKIYGIWDPTGRAIANGISKFDIVEQI